MEQFSQLKVNHPARTPDVGGHERPSTWRKVESGAPIHGRARVSVRKSRWWDDGGSVQQDLEQLTKEEKWTKQDFTRLEPILVAWLFPVMSAALDTSCIQKAKINTPSARPIHKNNKASRLQSTNRWDSLNKSYCWQSAAPAPRAHACTCWASAGHDEGERWRRASVCNISTSLLTLGESKVLQQIIMSLTGSLLCDS